MVSVEGKKGYINNEGKLVIQPQFIAAMDFQEGFAGVKIRKKYGHPIMICL